jgi:uncharacterized protein
MFCVMCIDKPDSEALRLANREAHLQYVVSQDYVEIGGPLVSDDGETMIGSLLLLHTQDRAQAEAFVENDPYHKAGLFARTEIHRWKHLLGGLTAP